MSVVVTTDLPSPHREKLAVVVRHLGGTYSGQIQPGYTTHLVTLHADGECAERARRAGDDDDDDDDDDGVKMTVVAPGWINACVREGRLLSAAETEREGYMLERKKGLQDDTAASLFRGFGFYLSTFYSESTRSTLRKQIEQEGGTVHDEFEERVTHVVCRFRVGDAYQWALHSGRTPVTAHWVDDCLQQRRVAPPQRVLHIPLPSNQPVEEMQGLQISITGFFGVDRTDLEFMIRSLGATFTGTLTRNNTHLICGKPGTDKHVKAVEWGSVKVVGKKWLEECIREWRYVDDKEYILDLPVQSKITRNDVASTKDGQNSKTPLFMFSGKPSKQERAIVERLRGQVSLVLGQYDPDCTHIILRNIARTEKFFCGCAAGKWILKPEFITACDSENKFLNEELYEWDGDKIQNIKGKQIWEGAPKKWRCHVEQTGKRAFERWIVILYGETKPPHSFLKKLIEVGGGQVITVTNGYVPDIDIDYAIIGKTNADDPVISSLLRKQIPCISGMFLPDFLALPSPPNIEKYKVL